MIFPSSLRSRFSNTLESHQIDEDYTESHNNNNGNHSSSPSPSTVMPPSPHHQRQPSLTMDATSTAIIAAQFDPYEVVPSYEASQRMHAHSGSGVGGTSTPIDDLSRPTQIYTPIPSLPIPQPISESTVMSESNSSEMSLNNNIIPQSSTRITMKRTSIKQLGLKFLNARQHFLLAFCRDVSLIPPCIGLVKAWRLSYYNNEIIDNVLTSARGSEHFLTGLWCIVAAYLSYSILDSLLVRWIVIYSTSAAIVRVLSMSTIIITFELYLTTTFLGHGQTFGLHIWLLISCVLTFAYIVQNFVTSNLELTSRKGIRQKARFFDFYNIVVFAVVPVGLASFVTMIGLLRSLLLLRREIDQSLPV